MWSASCSSSPLSYSSQWGRTSFPPSLGPIFINSLAPSLALILSWSTNSFLLAQANSYCLYCVLQVTVAQGSAAGCYPEVHYPKFHWSANDQLLHSSHRSLHFIHRPELHHPFLLLWRCLCCALGHVPLFLPGQRPCIHIDGVCEVQKVWEKKECGGARYNCGYNMGYVDVEKCVSTTISCTLFSLPQWSRSLLWWYQYYQTILTTSVMNCKYEKS